MATIEKKTRQEEYVNIQMSLEEASFLYRLFGNHILGSGKAREFFAEIYSDLGDLFTYDCTKLDLSDEYPNDRLNFAE